MPVGLRITGLALVLALGLTGVADAKLRSPRLTESCAQGRVYGEFVYGPWRVEGCHAEATPQGRESVRREFYGDVEVNGMIVEGSGEPLIATIATVPNSAGRQLNRVRRTDAKVVLDPRIGGERRRIVLFDGNLDLQINTPPRSASELGGEQPHIENETVPGRRISKAQARGTFGEVDIPVNGIPALLGLRVRDRIEDADVVAGAGTATDPGSITFRPPVSLGATASALLKDWEGNLVIKTVDGTGMTVDSLRFRVPDIEIPGIGGFEDLSIEYSAARDEWSGAIKLDLGANLFSLDLEMSVSASTGAPTRIAGTVDNLNIPVGNTGILLQRISALFNNNPLEMGVGAGATAGPKFGNFSVIELNGDLLVRLEPKFRLEASGSARVFPTGSDSQLARGRMSLIVDSRGYISVGGEARYDLVYEPLDLGASVDIGGSGAYSSIDDVFNIETFATGTAHLWVFGDVDVFRFRAVVSSNGWGFCGSLPGILSFVAAGIGQEWDRNPVPLLGCDLSRFDANVPDPDDRRKVQPVRKAQDGARAFTLPGGVKTLALELTGAGADPKLEVVNPQGNVVASTGEQGTRAFSGGALVAPPGKNVQYVFLRNPAAGRWSVRAAAGSPALTQLRIARDMPAVRAKVAVARVKGRPGRRRLRVTKLTGLAAGERVQIGVRTPNGVLPLGSTEGSGLNATFEELAPGSHQIVASVLRDGIPLPQRTRVIGTYKATVPAFPARVQATRRKNQVFALARPAKGAEAPQAWQYVLRSGVRRIGLLRAGPGKVARFTVGPRARALTVSVRPVVSGRAQIGKAKTAVVR